MRVKTERSRKGLCVLIKEPFLKNTSTANARCKPDQVKFTFETAVNSASETGVTIHILHLETEQMQREMREVIIPHPTKNYKVLSN